MAERVIEVIKKLPSKNLKRAYLIYQLNNLVEENVSANLAKKIQRILNIKNVLLQLFKNNSLPVSQIRVKAGYREKEKNNRKEKISNNCLDCGKEINSTRTFCTRCQNKLEQRINNRVRIVLRETPWIRYEQLREELKKFDMKLAKEDFEKIREKLRAETFDFIKKFSYELYQNSNETLRREMKRRAEFYTMIKNLLTIDQIDDKIIEKTLGGMLYSVIYKNPKYKAKN